MSKYLDYDGLAYFWGKIKALFNGKVDKETGKGLSTNDFTTTLKDKLDGIASNAQVNVIETVKQNGTALTVTDKAVNVTVPTKTSDLTNDSNFVTDANYVHTDNNFTTTLKDKLDGITQNSFYGTCATGAGTSAKVVTLSGVSDGFALETGVMVRVKFTNANTYNGTATLNVNSTGAKSIVRVGTTTSTRYYWSAGEVIDFVYDGTYWAMSRTGVATTTYYGITKLTTSGASTSTSTALTPASLNNVMQYAVTGLPVYSTTGTYAVGDMVRYGNYIYKCNTAITSGEAWTASHWTAQPSLLDMIEDKADISDIPTKTSDLTNDSGFITSADIPAIPTKTSDLTNDSNFVADANYVHTDNNFTTTLKNKLDGIASNAQVNVIETVKRNGTALTVTNKTVDITVPTKNSELTNDMGFAQVSSLPTKTSDLTNDSGFITSADVPTKTSDLTNDSGFITSSSVPTKTSELINDSDFLTQASYITRNLESPQWDIETWNSGTANYSTLYDEAFSFTLTYSSGTYTPVNDTLPSFEYLMSFISSSALAYDKQGVGSIKVFENGILKEIAYIYGASMTSQTTGYMKAVSGLFNNTLHDFTISITITGEFSYTLSITEQDIALITSETDPTVPAWAKASTKPTYTASEVGALATTGGQITGDLTLYTPSGNSPAIVFQRGTLTDNYNDWKIYDKSGFLYFAQRGSGSSAFGDVGYIDTGGVLRSFTIPWGSVTGKPAQLPTVTTSDNGKVLRVVNGAWSAVELPSASGVSF